MRRFLLLAALLFAAALLVFGLRSIPQLASYYAPIGSRVEAKRGDPFSKLGLDGPVVGLASSGGGSRAAYLTAAVLREIRRSGLRLNPDDPANAARSLLDQIDVVSAVSGGSLASAYFVANAETLKRAPADDPAWTAFLEKMALGYRTNQYWKALASPSLWAKLIFTNYNRGLLARDDYDAVLFGGATLASLPERPALYINSFDVANHVRFIFSKHRIDTAYYQPKDYWGKLAAPQSMASANDLTFVNVDPGSVALADAVYASSAFPIVYPNMALNHHGTKILFQGSRILLADGALADNSGLITLLTQLRVALRAPARPSSVLAIGIDASLDRVDTNGTIFQQRGIEERYPWEGTVFEHGIQSINSAIALLQDVGWKFIEGTDVVTDQLNMNWEKELTARTGSCGAGDKASWRGLFESGKLSMRPLVLRLGLRDAVNPEFLMRVDAWRQTLPEEARKGWPEGLAAWARTMTQSLTRIDTDFALDAESRKTLDVVALLLVNFKLAGDLQIWQAVARDAAALPRPSLTCTP